MNYISNDNRLNKIIEDFENLYNKYRPQNEKPLFEDIPIRLRIKMLIYLCGICHNMNWEYLCNNFMIKLKVYSKDFDDNLLKSIDEKTVEEFFAEYPKKHKVEAQRRAEIIRDIANDILLDETIIDRILETKSLEGENGFFNIVNNNIHIYNEDPQHKKTNLLAQILINNKILNVEDEYNIEPLVDYHIIRLYLRTGRIKIVNENIVFKIMNKEQLELEIIIELRKLIGEQIKRFCKVNGKTADELNTIDWYIARNICEVNSARCEECLYNKYCDSYGKDVEKMLIEPVDNHGFY